MSRPKRSKNRKTVAEPLNTLMSSDERLEFLAQLIIEKIEQDQNANECLLKEINIGETTH